MPAKRPKKGTAAAGGTVLTLRLYVAGRAPNSVKAIANLEAICRQHLAGAYKLEIVDVCEHPRRALYVVDGAVELDGVTHRRGVMLVFREGARASVKALEPARVMLLGGADLDGPRHIYWNFVSSSQERIERAKTEWRERSFPRVPGDAEEYVPLP